MSSYNIVHGPGKGELFGQIADRAPSTFTVIVDGKQVNVKIRINRIEVEDDLGTFWSISGLLLKRKAIWVTGHYRPSDGKGAIKPI